MIVENEKLKLKELREQFQYIKECLWPGRFKK